MEGVALELCGRPPLPPGHWLPLVCGSAGAPFELPSKGLAGPWPPSRLPLNDLKLACMQEHPQ